MRFARRYEYYCPKNTLIDVTTTSSAVLEEYGCYGFNTFGPFKLIGGIAKNHPDDTDIKNAISFYNNLYK